ncbi:MAG: hypothetical protein ACRDMJ_16475, partial [Solirubrobacteraceae bacterium]
YTGWAALGLASAGRDLKSVGRRASLISYVRASAGSSDPGALERTILVVSAAGVPARSFAGHNLVAELLRDVRADGSIHGQVNWTAFGVLALRGAGAGVPARMLAWLAVQQDRDGGFSFAGRGGASDVDDTGAALQALAADRAASAVRRQAVSFLRRQQNRDGGLPSLPGMSSNSQSTAWAVQGLLAAGVAPSEFRRAGGPSPLDYLRSLAGSNGAIAYARGMSQTPVWVTGEALAALDGRPLPLATPKPVATLKPLATPKPRPPAESPLQGLAGLLGALTALVLAPTGLG